MIKELNSRGIFTDDRIVTMQRKLTELEFLKPERPRIITKKSRERKAKREDLNYIDFYSSFFANELKKIDKSVDTRGMNKKTILKELDKRLKGKNTIIGLIAKYKTFARIPNKELIQFLKRYVSRFEIENDDLYYLLCIGAHFNYLIDKVMKDVESYSFKELTIFLQSMHTCFNTFNKKYKKLEPKFPSSSLESVLKKSIEYINTCNFYELINLIDSASKLHPQSYPENLRLLQVEMVNHPLIPEYMENKDLVKFLANLPDNETNASPDSVKADPDIILKYLKVFESRFKEFWLGDLVEVFLGIHRAGFKISEQLRIGLEDISLEYLETVNMYTVINLLKGLSESRCLSENMAKQLIKWFELEMDISNDSFQRIADMCYTVHKSGYTSFLIKEPNPLLRLMNPNGLMNLQSMLKFSIVFAPHITLPEFFPLVIRTFKRIQDLSPELSKVFPLICELQSNLLNFCQEEPIFNYQLESSQTLFFKEKTQLINYLHSIIEDYQPEDKLTFQYYSEFGYAHRPSKKIFDSLTKDNIFFACKALWRFRITDEVGDYVGKSAFLLIDPEGKDNTQIIYYVTTAATNKKSISLDLVDSKSEFYLPLCYEVGMDPVVTDELLTNIRHSNLVFGEILIKTLIMAIKFNFSKSYIRNLTKGLSYYPKNHPNPNIELKKLLIKELIKDKDLVNIKAFSVFIEQMFESFKNEELKEIFEFLADDENFSDSLKDQFARVGFGKTNFNCCYPDICIKDVREITDCMKENFRILEKMIEGKIYGKEFFSSLLRSVRNGECSKEEFIEVMPKILEFLSNFGDYDGNFEVIVEYLKNYELFEALTQKDIINLLFLNLQSPILPPTTTQTLLNQITPSAPVNSLKLNQDLSLNYYTSFTYTTTYEPRYVISNHTSQTSNSRTYIEYFPVSFNTFISNLKHFLVLEHFNISPTEDISQSINSYLIKFTTTNYYSLALLELKVEQDVKFGLKFRLLDRNISQTQLSCLGKVLACFKGSNKAILMIDQDCFALEVRGDKGGDVNHMVLMSPVAELEKYAERLTGLEIESFNMRNFEKKIYDPKFALSFLIHKKNPYY